MNKCVFNSFLKEIQIDKSYQAIEFRLRFKKKYYNYKKYNCKKLNLELQLMVNCYLKK